MSSNFARLMLIALLLVFCSCDRGGTGCDNRPNDDGDAQDLGHPIPSHDDLARGYANQLPREAHGVLVARGFDQLVTLFDFLKPRLEGIFDVGLVEIEIRNTFGLDWARPRTFRDAGVDYEGGVAIAMVNQQLVIAFYVTDRELFLSRVDEFLSNQPFDLQAPIVRIPVGDGVGHIYSEEHGGRVMAMAFETRGIGFLLARGRMPTDLSVVAHTIAATTPETSLASHPQFDSQVERFRHNYVFAFYDPETAAPFYRHRLGSELSSSARATLDYVAESVTSMAAGGRFDDGVFYLDCHFSMVPEETAAWAAITSPTTSVTDLSQFLSANSFVGARASLNPDQLRGAIARFQSDSAFVHFDEEIASVNRGFAGSLVTGLMETISGDFLLTLNRAAPLSLMRASTPGDYADGVGVVGAFRLADAAGATRFLEGLAAEDGTLSAAPDGEHIQYRARRPQDDFGFLTIRDNTLVWSTNFMAGWIPTLLGEGTDHLPEWAPGVQDLVGSTASTGLFLRFAPTLPLAVLVNLSRDVRDLLALVDYLVARVESDPDGLRLRFRLHPIPTP